MGTWLLTHAIRELHVGTCIYVLYGNMATRVCNKGATCRYMYIYVLYMGTWLLAHAIRELHVGTCIYMYYIWEHGYSRMQ